MRRYVDVLIGYLPESRHYLAIVWIKHAGCYDQVCLSVRRLIERNSTNTKHDILHGGYIILPVSVQLDH